MIDSLSNSDTVFEICASYSSGRSRGVSGVSTEIPFGILCTKLSNLNTLIEQSDRDSLIEQSHPDAIKNTLLQ